jgi:hypothetical protein
MRCFRYVILLSFNSGGHLPSRLHIQHTSVKRE